MLAVFVKLSRQLIDPRLWSKFEQESCNHNCKAGENTLAELSSTDLSRVKDELEEPDVARTKLNPEYYCKDYDEWNATEEFLEYVVLSFANDSAIYCIEELHEYESGEDYGQVGFLVLCKNTFLTELGSLASFRVPWAPICGLSVFLILQVVVRSTEPYRDEHYTYHPQGYSIDLTPYSLRENVLF